MRRHWLFVLTGLAIIACSPSNSADVQAVSLSEASLETLSVQDSLAVQEDLIAGFQAGNIEASEFLSGMAAFAKHPNPTIVAGSTRMLDVIHREFPDLRRGLSRHILTTYGRRYRSSRGTDTIDDEILSLHLGTLMAVEGNDQEARNYLIRQGSIYLGLDGHDDAMRATVPLNVLRIAFAETLKARPDVTFDPLLTLIETGDPLERSSAYEALTATRNPAQAEQLLSGLISDKSPIHDQSQNALIAGLLRNPVHQEQSWQWLTDNFDRLTSNPAQDMKDISPEVAAIFCSAERKDEVAELFAERAAQSPQTRARLDRAIDQIKRCIQMKRTQTDSLREALGA